MRMRPRQVSRREPCCKLTNISVFFSLVAHYLLYLVQKCTCENKAAINCAKKCGGKPKTKKCPTPTTTATPSPTPTYCGSRAIPPCAEGQTCIADPSNLGCSLIADCAGLCMYISKRFCYLPYGGWVSRSSFWRMKYCSSEPGHGSVDH